MKSTFCLYIALLILALPSSGQEMRMAEVPVEGSKVNMLVLPQGHINIGVSTNVNHFYCSLPGHAFQTELPVGIEGKGDSLIFHGFHLPLEVAAFNCGPKIRTKEFRELLEYQQHPQIKLSILELHIDPMHLRKQALISIDIHGKKVTKMVQLDWTDHKHLEKIKGSCGLQLSDFNIEAPVKAMGLIKVKNDINISFDLQLQTKL